MIFTPADIDAFIAISGDTNPLHTSNEYAQASGFAGRVVPGMLAVTTALNNVHPKTVRARFAEPLYCNTEYLQGKSTEDDRFWFGANPKRAAIWVGYPSYCKRFVECYGDNAGVYSKPLTMSRKNFVLCWISWFVGTQLPGAGGIIGNVELEFMQDGNPVTDRLKYAVRVAQKSLGMVVMDAVLSDGDKAVAYCEIRAMEKK